MKKTAAAALAATIILALSGCTTGQKTSTPAPTAGAAGASPEAEQTPGPQDQVFRGSPGTHQLSETETCFEVKAIAGPFWFPEQPPVEHTNHDMETMLKDLKRLSNRAPDGLRQGIANYADMYLDMANPASQDPERQQQIRLGDGRDGAHWTRLVQACDLYAAPTPTARPDGWLMR